MFMFRFISIAPNSENDLRLGDKSLLSAYMPKSEEIKMIFRINISTYTVK